MECPAAFVSMNRVRRRRRSDDLAALGTVFVDLDVHRIPGLAGLPRDTAAGRIRETIGTHRLPTPSWLVDSGRGFYAVWLTEDLPPAAAPRWQAAMRALVDLLSPLGADASRTDPVRVLRLPGSMNARAGREVTIVAGAGERAAFDRLADGIYRALGRPTRGDLGARRSDTAKQRATAGQSHPRGLPRRRRWALVREDLLTPLAHWGGRIPVGYRDLWLHLMAVALTHMIAPEDIAEEVASLAAGAAPDLTAREVRRYIAPTIERARRAAIGKRRRDGQDPRYDYAGARVAAMLDVDVPLARELGLAQVIPQALRDERTAERRRARRRASGATPRDVWLAAHGTEREQPWIAEGISRSTWYRRHALRREAEEAPRSAELADEGGDETGAASLYGGSATADAEAATQEGPRHREAPPLSAAGPPRSAPGRPRRHRNGAQGGEGHPHAEPRGSCQAVDAGHRHVDDPRKEVEASRSARASLIAVGRRANRAEPQRCGTVRIGFKA